MLCAFPRPIIFRLKRLDLRKEEPRLATVVAPRPELTGPKNTLIRPRESLGAKALNKDETLRLETPIMPKSSEGDERLQTPSWVDGSAVRSLKKPCISPWLLCFLPLLYGY
jgi:hypothetical protein